MSVGNAGVSGKVEAYATYSVSDKTKTKKTSGEYGKTIGEPTLSEEAKKYYEELKQKYSNMDFILVSREMKDKAQAQAASYANPLKTVVLIDEDKIERMATDEAYRKKYEAIISGAASKLTQMKTSIQSTGAKVQGFGMQVNDGGLTSFFAVLKKSSIAQAERIAKKAEEKRAKKKEAKKKAAEEAYEERLDEKRAQKDDNGRITEKESDTITITASSVEELMQKISDYEYIERSNSVKTQEELNLGQHIDFQA